MVKKRELSMWTFVQSLGTGFNEQEKLKEDPLWKKMMYNLWGM